jgi:hypothetical protein
LAIVFSVLHWFVSSEYSFGFFKHLAIVFYVFHRLRHKSMKDRENNGQKFEDTKGLFWGHKSMKDREHNGQKFEDTKGVFRRHKSMKDREHNGQSLKMPKG